MVVRRIFGVKEEEYYITTKFITLLLIKYYSDDLLRRTICTGHVVLTGVQICLKIL
jgi:hypothetical protein